MLGMCVTHAYSDMCNLHKACTATQCTGTVFLLHCTCTCIHAYNASSDFISWYPPIFHDVNLTLSCMETTETYVKSESSHLWIPNHPFHIRPVTCPDVKSYMYGATIFSVSFANVISADLANQNWHPTIFLQMQIS